MLRIPLLSATAAIVLAASSFSSARQAPAPAAAAPAAAQPAGQRGGGRGGGPIISPEVAADGRVTFRLRAPGAKEVLVSVAGRRLPLQKDEAGLWSLTTDALAPDIYPYSFVVDGATMNDPANRQVQTSFGSFQSMAVVPGPKPWLPAAGVPRGAIARHAFRSAFANDERDFFVYTPPGYDRRRGQAYPVLYLLHGLGDDAERWLTGGGGAHHILDNLIAAGQAVPMVVVSPLGYGTSRGPAGGRQAENIIGYEKILFDEVMPVVNREYNVSRNREERAIAGLSMGGAQALYVGLNHLDTFAWIGAFSSAPMVWPAIAGASAPDAARGGAARGGAARGGGRGDAPSAIDPAAFDKTFPGLDPRANARLRMLWIVCGTGDSLIGANRQFKDWLRSKGVQFTELEVPDAGHVWPLWRQNVADMVPKLFRKASN
jgi:enterochelin esterase family protein